VEGEKLFGEALSEFVLEFIGEDDFETFLTGKGIEVKGKPGSVITAEALGLGKEVIRVEVGEFKAELRVFVGEEFGRIGYLTDGDGVGRWFKFPDEIGLTQEDIEEDFENWTYENESSLYDLIDPPMSWENFRDQEVDFSRGTKERLDEIIRLIVLADLHLSAAGQENIEITGINSHFPDSEMGWETSWEADSQTKEALDRVISEVEFSGVEWVYNDGASDNRSGYDPCGPRFFFEVADLLREVSSRERMEAARDLKGWLKGEIELFKEEKSG
jgi:hypothetical protein